MSVIKTIFSSRNEWPAHPSATPYEAACKTISLEQSFPETNQWDSNVQTPASETNRIPEPFLNLGALQAVTSRRILLITYHFPPSAASGSFRMLGFARHLPAHGWNVSVVAPPSLPWEPVDHGLSKLLPVDISLQHVPYPNTKVARRLAQMACWLPGAWSACKTIIRNDRPEVILTSGPPHIVHYLGFFLKQHFKIPWVADFRDPWYVNGRLDRGRGLSAKKIAIQERLILRSADLTIANAPGARETYCRDYPDIASRFVMIPNGYDRETFDAIPDTHSVSTAPIKIVHTGALYLGRDPRPFFDALRYLSDCRPCPGPEAQFYGPAPELGFDLAKELQSRGLTNRVKLQGQVSYSACIQQMKCADILLMIDTPGRSVGVPAKLYEYIGAGRPILALGTTGGDLEWVLQRSGIPYRITPIDDPGQIASAIAELGRQTVQQNRTLRTEEPFSRDTIAGNLAECLNQLVVDFREKQRRDRESRLPAQSSTIVNGC